MKNGAFWEIGQWCSQISHKDWFVGADLWWDILYFQTFANLFPCVYTSTDNVSMRPWDMPSLSAFINQKSVLEFY